MDFSRKVLRINGSLRFFATPHKTIRKLTKRLESLFFTHYNEFQTNFWWLIEIEFWSLFPFLWFEFSGVNGRHFLESGKNEVVSYYDDTPPLQKLFSPGFFRSESRFLRIVRRICGHKMKDVK